MFHSTQFELLNFDGAIQFRCWGDTTSMLGRRNLGWDDVTWGDKAMGRHNLHSNLIKSTRRKKIDFWNELTVLNESSSCRVFVILTNWSFGPQKIMI